jgi:hypothetical protein
MSQLIVNSTPHSSRSAFVTKHPICALVELLGHGRNSGQLPHIDCWRGLAMAGEMTSVKTAADLAAPYIHETAVFESHVPNVPDDEGHTQICYGPGIWTVVACSQ